ncbi:MAG: PTS sugar transporter subunit IIA [Steroidobacteraceae bacterium]
MNETPLFSPARVAVDVHARSIKHLLDLAAGLLTGDAPHLSAETAFDALLARERLGSTAIGGGVAVPHGRLALVRSPCAAVLQLAEPVDMDAPDGLGVDLVVAVLVPEQCGTSDIAVLSGLVQSLADAKFCATLRQASGARALYDLLADHWRGDAAA